MPLEGIGMRGRLFGDGLAAYESLIESRSLSEQVNTMPCTVSMGVWGHLAPEWKLRATSDSGAGTW